MKKNDTERMTIVIGASRLGATIASAKSASGAYTSIIDKNPLAFRKLDSSYSGYQIEGDAEDMDVLEKANARGAKEFDIMTESDDENLYLAAICLVCFDAPLIVVRLQDEKKSVLLDDKRIRFITPSLLSYRAYQEIQDAFADVSSEGEKR